MDHPGAYNGHAYDMHQQFTFISPPSYSYSEPIVVENTDWSYNRFQPSSLRGMSPLDEYKPRPIRSESLLAAEALTILRGDSPHSLTFASSPPRPHIQTPHFGLDPNSPSDPLKFPERFQGTPIQQIFASSPTYWDFAPSSISPVIRTSSPHHASHRTNSAGSPIVHSQSRPLYASRLRFATSDHSASPLTSISSTTSTPHSAADAASPAPPLRGRKQTRGIPKTRTDSNPNHIPDTDTHDTPIIPDSPSPLRRSTRATRAKMAGRSALRHVDQSSSVSRERIVPARTKRRSSSSHGRNTSKRSRMETKPNSVSSGPLINANNEQREDASGDEDDCAHALPMRTFPPNVEINPDFPLMYRRFYVCSLKEGDNRKSGLAGSTWNETKGPFDLYTPRFVKGKGNTKVGLCPICYEPVKRGGINKKTWLSTKYSAFKCYHMQYNHGISPVTKAPFYPPLAFQLTDQPAALKNQKTKILKGKCHKCQKWVPVEGPKDVETKVKEIFWWKHCALCHRGSTIKGERDIFVEDELFIAAQKMELDD